MKKILYNPVVNTILRTVARPFSTLIPEGYKFPVTGVIKVKVSGGHPILIRCNPTSFVARKLFWGGMDGFEQTMARLFASLAKEAHVFLDVGANIGYYSLLASAINPSLKIVSFEPAPAVYKYLKANKELNNFVNLRAEQLAMSDQAGELEFFISRNPKYVHIAEDHLTSTGSFDKIQADRTFLLESVKVKTTTLDAYVAQHQIPRVDLIKLDTEATEHLVLAGAPSVLSEHKPVIFCEVLPGKVEQEIEAAFKRHDYLMYRLADGGVEQVTTLQHDASRTNDHLMIHPDRLPEVEPLLSTFQT